MNHRVKCNLCGSTFSEVMSRYTRFERNTVLRCKKCGLVFLEPKQEKKEIETFYKKKYRDLDTLPVVSAQELFTKQDVRNDSKNRIAWIKERYDLRNKKVLELGSSSGYFLKQLSSVGSKASGVELNDDHAEYARKLGFHTYTKPIEDIGLKEEFDLIVTFHSLEHFFNPRKALRAVYASLKKRGMFLGEVPNQDDWRIKIFGNEVVKRFHYDPNHYFYFSPATLTRYLTSSGFTGITLETVERYNSLLQLKRILSGGYTLKDARTILKQDIFATPKDDTRIPHIHDAQETDFNRVFSKGINAELLGNCLRWTAVKTE